MEYVVRLHADGELVDVATEEDDLWAHVYNCLQHPPCAQCERCLMFKDVLSEYSMEDVFDLVDGKEGSSYAFDCRHVQTDGLKFDRS